MNITIKSMQKYHAIQHTNNGCYDIIATVVDADSPEVKDLGTLIHMPLWGWRFIERGNESGYKTFITLQSAKNYLQACFSKETPSTSMEIQKIEKQS